MLRKGKKVIQSIVLIHNFRTELVGLNQIATVFDPEYERYIIISRGSTLMVRIRINYIN